ncbi:DNA helicase, partial [Tanacetum coccineum]
LYPERLTSTRGKSENQVDVKLLDTPGNIIDFTMWDEMAESFNKSILDTLEPPVIIAVSSCRVSKCRAATPATYYYLNPNILEADQSRVDKKATIKNDSYHCIDYGPQPEPGYRYNFMAFITDPSATGSYI